MRMLVIDRFEEAFAVLEDIQTRQQEEFLKSELPPEAREGDVLEIDEADGSLRISEAETAARYKRIREKFNRLKRRKRL